MPSRISHYALLLLTAGLVFFTQLGKPPLWDRDEPRNAGCAAEMLARGDWVVPVFNAELRTHKPVLLYWLMMSSYQLFGVNEFAARFWSAVLAGGTVLLTYEIARRLFDARTACWGALVLTTTLMFDVAARAATPDSALIFCGTLALAIFVHGAFSGRPDVDDGLAFPAVWPHGAAMYAVMGLGILAKGPIGIVLPTAVIGMHYLIVRLPPGPSADGWRRVCLNCLRPFQPRHFLLTFSSLRPLTALLFALVVALPWYVAVTWRTDGAWTRGFFLEHNLGRAVRPMEGHGGPALLFYLGAVLVGCFPWSILSVPTGMTVARALRGEDQRRRRALVFLLCWAGVYLGLFSLARTKLPSYVTPCYPALAILIGYCISQWRTVVEAHRVWVGVGLGSLLAVGLGLGIGLPLAAHRWMPGTEWLGVAGLAPVIGAVLGLWWLRQARDEWIVRGLAASAIAFSVVMTSVLPVEIGKRQKYTEFLTSATGSEAAVAAFGHLEPSWVFYGGRPIHYFPSNQSMRLLDFLSRHPDANVITSRQRLGELERQAETPLQVVASTSYFLRDRELVLVRPRGDVVRAVEASSGRDESVRR